MLHDSHKTPEPILVASGLTYLIPTYTAYYSGNTNMAFACGFLTFTTVAFHGTRQEHFFVLDCFAIVYFLGVNFRSALASGNYALAVFSFSTAYSLTSYFAGMQYKRMSFDPDWNTQMFYHSLMHLSTAYSAYASLA